MPVGHEDRLSLVEHLDELRTRILVSLAAVGVAFALCFWPGRELLFEVANAPLPAARRPITFGVTEPFFTTVTLSAYAALILALPVVLYQAYAFVMPAFRPGERRAVLPLLLAVPVLFAAGVAFAYFVAAPRAIGFLLGFNESQFNVQVRARDYYGFLVVLHLGLGLLFQVPVGVLAVSRLGLVTPDQLRRNRRYALLVAAVVAMIASPGGDPVTMLIFMAPLVLLFELSILLARAFGRPSYVGLDAEPSAAPPR